MAKAKQAAAAAAAAEKARQAAADAEKARKAADAAAAEKARRATADAAAEKARQAANEEKARTAAADAAAAEKARLAAANSAAAEKARKAAADAAANVAADKAKRSAATAPSSAGAGEGALDFMSHGVAGAMGALSSLAGSLLSSLDTPAGKAAVGGTLAAGILLLLRARRGKSSSSNGNINNKSGIKGGVDGSKSGPPMAVAMADVAISKGRGKQQPVAPLGSGFDDAVISLLLLPKRTPGEEARLKALLLLLSQSQPSPQGALGSDGDTPGAWRLVWAEKPLFWLWRGLDPLLTPAEQALDTGAGTLASSATAGPVTVTARGSFTPAKSSTIWGSKPEFELDVNDGSIALDVGSFSMSLPLLAKGGGSWQVVYADARLRVFHSDEAGLAAQLVGALVEQS